MEESVNLTKKTFNLKNYALFWTIALLLAVPIAYAFTRENVLYNFYLILISPSKLVTDYFCLGGLAASFLNAGLCGLFCNVMIAIFKPQAKSNLLAGYFLVIAHCFYGLNLLNMILPFLGIIIYCLIRKTERGNV